MYKDSLTKAEFNSSYIAHIIADKEGGPRGHATLSEELKDDISNLMLLCDEHHRLIDIKQVEEHPVELLQKMKRKHEQRMELQTDISESKESHVILYGANIGSHSSPVIYKDTLVALSPDLYPSNKGVLELSLSNSSFEDDDPEYWKFEEANLVRKFQQKITPLLESSEIQTYSVFGIAPQPLLIKLGTLLYDLANVHVFNNQKEPKTWKWSSQQVDNNFFKIIKPEKTDGTIALVFALSADINDDRIQKVLGDGCSIWKITLSEPNNDYIKSREHLAQFRTVCREVLNEIKTTHGENGVIHIFPAMQPSTAIELGRLRYPKADLPFIVYDQNRKRDGFIKTLEI
ncbi:MAG: HNH endonuclease [Patiriisocius sp.]|uniref:HNH endonuclease n=1 Tax=Patiriisocius sp. TaxID=2822396 RepID=UPI003EF49A37